MLGQVDKADASSDSGAAEGEEGRDAEIIVWISTRVNVNTSQLLKLLEARRARQRQYDTGCLWL